MHFLKSYSFFFAVLGVIATIAFVTVTGKPGPPAQYAQQPSISPYTDYIAATGIIEAQDKNIEVGTPEEGVIEKLYFKVGDSVTKGDPLFLVDTRDLQSQLELLKSNIDVEEANLQKAKQLLERFKGVKNPRSISKEDLQSRTDDVNIAEARLKFAKAAVARIQKLIDRHLVVAPINGVILQQNIREGEFLQKNMSAILIGDMTNLQVRVDIDEQNATRFDKEASAVAFPKNNTNLSIPLRFTRIEPYIIPKETLVNSKAEKVDTRVLQVIYAFTPPKNYPIYVGLQVDVFLTAEQPPP